MFFGLHFMFSCSFFFHQLGVVRAILRLVTLTYRERVLVLGSGLAGMVYSLFVLCLFIVYKVRGIFVLSFVTVTTCRGTVAGGWGRYLPSNFVHSFELWLR